MSTTPRTDANTIAGTVILHNGQCTAQMVSSNFARQLETELAAEREKVRVLEESTKPFIEYAKAYGACTCSELWAPNGTKLKPRDWRILAATEASK